MSDGTSVEGKRAIVGKASGAAGLVGFREPAPVSVCGWSGRGEDDGDPGAEVPLGEEASMPAGEDDEGAERWWRSAQAKDA